MDAVLIIVLLISLYTDITYKKILNIVTFPAVVVGILGNVYFYGIPGGADSMKGLLLGLALLMIPYILGGMGAGDVKLLGVVGAFKGTAFVFSAFLTVALVGGVIALVLMIKQGKFTARVRQVFFTVLSVLGVIPRMDLLGSFDDASALTFPYGSAIVVGTILTYFVRWIS